MARSCPSTMSSDSVRIYWPWAGDESRQVSPQGLAHYAPLHAHPPLTPHLVVVDKVEVLQSRDDILLLDAGDFTDLVDGDLRPLPAV